MVEVALAGVYDAEELAVAYEIVGVGEPRYCEHRALLATAADDGGAGIAGVEPGLREWEQRALALCPPHCGHQDTTVRLGLETGIGDHEREPVAQPVQALRWTTTRRCLVGAPVEEPGRGGLWKPSAAEVRSTLIRLQPAIDVARRRCCAQLSTRRRRRSKVAGISGSTVNAAAPSIAAGGDRRRGCIDRAARDTRDLRVEIIVGLDLHENLRGVVCRGKHPARIRRIRHPAIPVAG